MKFVTRGSKFQTVMNWQKSWTDRDLMSVTREHINSPKPFYVLLQNITNFEFNTRNIWIITYFCEKLQHQDYDSNQRDLRRRIIEWVEKKILSVMLRRRWIQRDMQICVSTFNSYAFTGPLFFKGGEAFPLTDADDMLFEVKFFSVEAQESQPQLSHWLCVRLQLGQKPTLCRKKKHMTWDMWQEQKQIWTTFR